MAITTIVITTIMDIITTIGVDITEGDTIPIAIITTPIPMAIIIHLTIIPIPTGGNSSKGSVPLYRVWAFRHG
jgi:hypothetical protein